jgi:hypothetical protein
VDETDKAVQATVRQAKGSRKSDRKEKDIDSKKQKKMKSPSTTSSKKRMYGGQTVNVGGSFEK